MDSFVEVPVLDEILSVVINDEFNQIFDPELVVSGHPLKTHR